MFYNEQSQEDQQQAKIVTSPGQFSKKYQPKSK